MFVDHIEIYAKAGNGGNGVVRWRQEKFRPMAGPAGGNGGNGGSVFVRGVRNLNQLAKYTGSKKFIAADGEAGRSLSQYGKNSDDVYIDVPVGSVVTNQETKARYEISEEGQVEQLLAGGHGGLGNEFFKSSTNRSPQEATAGKPGAEANFLIELSLVADVGLIGLPNAGKSSLLNAITNATSKVNSYAFTTLVPHLGDLFGYAVVDIPGLIEGAASGKGLGLRFLRHVEKTNMLVHMISLENDDVAAAYKTVRKELADYKKDLETKEEWVVLNKKDLVSSDVIKAAQDAIDDSNKRVFVISTLTGDGVKELRDALVQHLGGDQQ